MRALHDDTEASVHELIKCGGLQTSLSRTFLIVLIASNRDLFDAAAYAELVQFAGSFGVDLQVPLTRGTAGLWSMPLDSFSASTFSLRFHDPVSGAVIVEDPFVMDSYLTGVTATSSLTIDEMKANLTARNRIEFAWQARAALAHVLNAGQPIPNPFSISVSFADLAQFVWGFDVASGEPDLGPLDALLELPVDSEVRLIDSRNGSAIDYDVEGLTATLREIGDRGVTFGVRSIVADNGSYRLSGAATGLRYDASAAGLVGQFRYRIEGPNDALMVTDTYDPDRGLSVEWSCVSGH